MERRLISAIFGIGLIGIGSEAQICGTHSAPRLIHSTPSEFHFFWEVTDRGELWRKTSNFDQDLLPFREWVKTFAPLDQFELLKVQQKFYRDSGLTHLVNRGTRVVQKRLGKIEPASCIEQYIFLEHLKKFPQSLFPAEFMATSFRSKRQKNMWRIYFSYGDGRLFDVSPPPHSPQLIEMMASDSSSESEWQAHSFVHSHPFMPKYEYRDPESGSYVPLPHTGGTVMPSDEDIEAYVQWMTLGKMSETSITNGLHSIRFKAKDLGPLKRELIWIKGLVRTAR